MSHLSKEQRYTIDRMLKEGYSQVEIAEVINRNKSVVCREIHRNGEPNGSYCAVLAHKKYLKRQKEKPKKVSFTQEMKILIEQQLKDKFSPEQISGTAKLNGIPMVSYESIYRYIKEDKKSGGRLYRYLPSGGKKYRKRGSAKDKRGTIPNRKGIEERPAMVEKRERIGDLEIDTIVGKGNKGAIVTINDRATGQVNMKKLEGKNAVQLAQATIELLMPYKDRLHTITADNGKEFSAFQLIADALNIDFFFATPYHSWERGSNEHINRLIRQYIPKKTDFSTLTDTYIQYVADQLNHRPRKRYGFLSPNQVIEQTYDLKP